MKRARYRAAVIGVGVIALLAVGWLVLRPASRRPTPPAATPPEGPPGATAPGKREEIAIKNPTLKHSEGGRLAWQVRLRELQVSAGGAAVAAAGMREALIYDQTGAPALRLTADRARGNTSERNLEVFGNVRAVSPKGALLTTEKMRWVEAERQLHCPGKVVLRNRDLALTTVGLIYLVDEDLIQCPGQVRMYSGQNKLMGRELEYNVANEAFTLRRVQAAFNPRELRQ